MPNSLFGENFYRFWVTYGERNTPWWMVSDIYNQRLTPSWAPHTCNHIVVKVGSELLQAEQSLVKCEVRMKRGRHTRAISRYMNNHTDWEGVSLLPTPSPADETLLKSGQLLVSSYTHWHTPSLLFLKLITSSFMANMNIMYRESYQHHLGLLFMWPSGCGHQRLYQFSHITIANRIPSHRVPFSAKCIPNAHVPLSCFLQGINK